MKRACLCIVALLSLSVSAPLRAAEEAPKVRILGIGNSFTQNATHYLTDICRSDPAVNAEVAVACIGGSPMDLHVRLAQMAVDDPDDPRARRYALILNARPQKERHNLIELLRLQPWDYVTIQQVSTRSHLPESYSPCAEQLQALIRQYAPTAKLVIHETWAHRNDCPRVKAWDLPPEAMYAKLHAAYAQVAAKLGAPVIPVGTAFEEAKTRPLWQYEPPAGFDPAKLVHPAPLPDESKSLHSGYRWRKDGKTGAMAVTIDGYHANTAGEYLGGLVWYEFFFRGDARAITFAPKGLSDEQAASLRDVAHATMARKDWRSVPAN